MDDEDTEYVLTKTEGKKEKEQANKIEKITLRNKLENFSLCKIMTQ